MSYIRQLKEYFYKRQIEKAEQHKVARRSRSLEQSKHIGLLFDGNDNNTVDAILAYAEKLRKKGKEVTLLGFLNTKEPVADNPFPYFNKKQIRFNLVPKGADVEKFIQQKFDLLINFFPKDNLPLEYITTSSKAHCRIGNQSQKLHCFDLIIRTPKKEKDFAFFTRQIEQILSKMNRKTYESAV